jgi:hypothetical protein
LAECKSMSVPFRGERCADLVPQRRKQRAQAVTVESAIL